MDYLTKNARTHRDSEIFPLVDGEVSFGELLKSLRAATRFVYIATWNLDPGLELTRTGSADPTLREVLLAKAREGVEVKVLTWDHLSVVSPLGSLGELFRPDVGTFSKELRAAGANAKLGSGLHLTQNRFRPPGRLLATGSDHQKFWVMDEAAGVVAYLGGLNLGQHDWDTSEHIPGDKRRTKPGMNRDGIVLQDALKNPMLRPFVRGRVEKGLEDRVALSRLLALSPLSDTQRELLRTWIVDMTIEYLRRERPAGARHDVCVRLRGAVVIELLAEFRARWQLLALNGLKKAPTKVPPVRGAVATVQVGHTAYYGAPGKRNDIRNAYVSAIRRARDYIYIENQYFVSEPIAEAIADRLRHRRSLLVVLILPDKAEDFAVGPAIALRQFRLARALEEAARRGSPRTKRFHLFTLTRWHPAESEYAGIYVHSKVAVIDDAWMTVGSANCSPRSFELDTELNGFCADPKRVIAFRKTLWGEHLGVQATDGVLKNARRAIEKMAKSADGNADKKEGELVGRLRPLAFEPPAWWLQPFYEELAKEFL